MSENLSVDGARENRVKKPNRFDGRKDGTTESREGKEIMTASRLFLQEKIVSSATVEQMDEGWRNGEIERRWKKDGGMEGG